MENNKHNLNRVVLIALCSDLQKGPYEPLAIETLAGALLEEVPDINVSLKVIDSEKKLNQLIKVIKETKPDVIGLSVPQGTLNMAKDILSKIYNESELDTQIILGHAVPTRNEELKKEFPNIEIIKGWGEKEFINCTLRKLGRDPRELEDKFYIPMRIGGSQEYIRRIEANRGCNYGKCMFCTRPDDNHHKNWKAVNIEIIKAQLDEFKNMGITSFGFADEDFVGDPMQIPELVHLLKKYDFKFSAALRVETIVPDEQEKRIQRENEINELAKVGLSQVFLGVESFVETQQKRFNKHLKGGPNSCKEAIRILTDAGVDIEMGLIVFDIESTVEELMTTVDVLLKDDLYKSIDHPFASLRLQDGSLLARKYKVEKSKMNENTLCYDWKFNDPKVSKIFERCNNWFKPIHGIYSLARSLIRSIPADKEIREQLSEEIWKVRKQFITLLKAAVEKNEKDFIVFSESANANVRQSFQSISEIARKSKLFDGQTTLSKLDEALNIDKRTSKNTPISMVDYGSKVMRWEEKQTILENYNLPFQRHIGGNLEDFHLNPKKYLNILAKENYYREKFYLKIIQPDGVIKKIYGSESEIIQFVDDNYVEGANFETVAYLNSQLGAIIIKKDEAYLEIGVTDDNYFGLDKVKHSTPDIMLLLDNQNDIKSVRYNKTNYSEEELKIITDTIMKYIKRRKGIRYKDGDDNGIEQYTIPHYYEAMVYIDENDEISVFFCDATQNEFYANVDYEPEVSEDRCVKKLRNN